MRHSGKGGTTEAVKTRAVTRAKRRDWGAGGAQRVLGRRNYPEGYHNGGYTAFVLLQQTTAYTTQE